VRVRQLPAREHTRTTVLCPPASLPAGGNPCPYPRLADICGYRVYPQPHRANHTTNPPQAHRGEVPPEMRRWALVVCSCSRLLLWVVACLSERGARAGRRGRPEAPRRLHLHQMCCAGSSRCAAPLRSSSSGKFGKRGIARSSTALSLR
jgi:hypothetical protein